MSKQSRREGTDIQTKHTNIHTCRLTHRHTHTQERREGKKIKDSHIDNKIKRTESVLDLPTTTAPQTARN